MPDTRGFETVVQAGPEVVTTVLRAAWKSANCPDEPGDESRIPEEIQLPPPEVVIGGYRVAEGQIQIPQGGITGEYEAGFGVRAGFRLETQFALEDPPVPGASLLTMAVDVTARIPLAVTADGRGIDLPLQDIERAGVTAALPDGHPLDPLVPQLAAEMVHAAYENQDDTSLPSIPHTVTDEDVALAPGLVADVYVEIYDDLADPEHRIETTLSSSSQLRISLPVYLRISDIRASGLAALIEWQSPMGVEARLVLTCPFVREPGRFTARLSAATAVTEDVTPSPYPPEGDNYQANRDAIPVLDLEELLKAQLATRGQDIARDLGDLAVDIPTEEEIESAVAELFHAELVGRGRIPMWTPADDPNFTIDDVALHIGADRMSIGINASPGADLPAVAALIPPARDFAIAIDAAKVRTLIDASRAEDGLAESDLPKRIDADDEEVELRELDIDLGNGFLSVTGEVTVIDAILGSIDVDASFEACVVLHWVPDGELDAAGLQNLDHALDGDPDVDVRAGWLLFLVLFLVGLFTGGLLGGLIGLIVAAIVSAIAAGVGGTLVRDAVSGLPVGVGGWPSQLARIGEARSIFHDPVVIQPDGLLIAADLQVVSSCEETTIVAAYSGTGYRIDAGTSLTLQAGNTHADASYGWVPGDGAARGGGQDRPHVYAASGAYVALHDLTVDQPGGATTRHFTLVEVLNVPPTVDAGPDLVIDEGEVVTLVGYFADIEAGDVHESTWNFGDDSLPSPGVVSEIPGPAGARGTSTVQHAWCDDGTYTITLRVRDQNGGTATDTRVVTVRNVPPVVDAGPDRYAYPCSPITLQAAFRDPGWCDTHTGTWDFGDCTAPLSAIVRETNDPPAATGTAAATHVYQHCGRHTATVTVTDDDSGAGSGSLTVSVVELANPGFEDGFRPLAPGRVANGWTPYAGTKLGAAGRQAVLGERPPGRAVYDCEECIVHNGQRSQRVAAPPGLRVGILQRLGANPGWRYQVSAFATLADPGAAARLGINPRGTVQPTEPDTIWTAGRTYGEWGSLVAEVVAAGPAITIFLEVDARDGRPGVAYLDDVDVIAVQPHCPPETRPPPRERCLELTGLAGAIRSPLRHEGFTISSLSGEALVVERPAADPKVPALRVPPGGLEIELPCRTDQVAATVIYQGGKPPTLTGYGERGGPPHAHAEGAPDAGPVQHLELHADGIAVVVVRGQEVALVCLCVECPEPAAEDTWTARGVDTLLGGHQDGGHQDGGHHDGGHHDGGHHDGGHQDEAPGGEDPSVPNPAERLGLGAAEWAKLDRRLQEHVARSSRLPEHDRVQVLVVLDTPQPSPSAGRRTAFEAWSAPVERTLRQGAATRVLSLWLGNAIAAEAPLVVIAAVAHDDRVRNILLDIPRRGLIEPRRGEPRTPRPGWDESQ